MYYFCFITIFMSEISLINTDFYKIPSPFIIILSRKNAPFHNILLLGMGISVYSFCNVRPYTQLNKISLECLLITWILKRNQGKHQLTATGTVARKLTTVIYAVLRDGKPYEPKKFY